MVSTFRGLRSVSDAHGLSMSLYTDRGAYCFHTLEKGGEVDREHGLDEGVERRLPVVLVAGARAGDAVSVFTPQTQFASRYSTRQRRALALSQMDRPS